MVSMQDRQDTDKSEIQGTKDKELNWKKHDSYIWTDSCGVWNERKGSNFRGRKRESEYLLVGVKRERSLLQGLMERQSGRREAVWKIIYGWRERRNGERGGACNHSNHTRSGLTQDLAGSAQNNFITYNKNVIFVSKHFFENK